MEEEWRLYIKHNAPELYEQMRASINHIYNWRYKAGMLAALSIAKEQREGFAGVVPVNTIAAITTEMEAL